MTTITPSRERYERAFAALKSQADLIDAGKASIDTLPPLFAEIARSKAAAEDQVIARMSEVSTKLGFPAEAIASASTVNTASEGLGSMLAAHGFDLKSKPSVALSAMSVLTKANVFPAAADLSLQRHRRSSR